MNLLWQYSLALISVAISNIILGLFIYFKNRKSLINQTCALFCLCVGIWSYSQMRIMNAPNKEVALFWALYMYTSVFFIAPSYVHFVFVLVNKKINKKIIPTFYLVAFLLLPILYFTKLIVSEISFKFSFAYFGNAGFFHHIFLLMWLSLATYGLFELYIAYKNSSGQKRNQLRYVYYGTLIGYVGGCGNYFLVYNIELFPYTPFGTYGVVIYSIMLAYAILKHHLLDIDIVIKRGLVYSSLATLITIGYFLLIFLMERLFHGFMGYKSLPWTLFVVCLFILIFQPLKNKIQSFVDKYFFKGTIETIAQEKETLVEALKQSDKVKAIGVLAAGIAHEIKNPLTSIKTFVDYLEEKHNELAYRTKFRQIVAGEIDKIDTLTRQLMDFSKPQRLNLKDTDIHTVLDDSLNFMQDIFLSHNIQVVRQFGQDVSQIKADPNQLKQVFLNLFLNATDAMPTGGSLTIKTLKNESSFNIYVIDTGKGMTRDEISNIFSPFYSSKEDGTGLGLSVSERIVKEHRGEITCASTLHAGTTFIIKLPISADKKCGIG